MPTDTKVGGYLELIARALAIHIAFVYTLGFITGDLIHRLNDALAYRQRPRFCWDCFTYDLYCIYCEVSEQQAALATQLAFLEVQA